MAKLKTSGLRPVVPLRETRTFTDSNQDGEELEVTLQITPGADLTLKTQAKASDLIAKYLTGLNGGPPAPLPPVGGRMVELSENLLTACALLMEAEVCDNPVDKYDLMDWLKLSVTMPDAFLEVGAFLNELQEKASLKKTKIPDESPSSEPLSTTGSDTPI